MSCPRTLEELQQSPCILIERFARCSHLSRKNIEKAGFSNIISIKASENLNEYGLYILTDDIKKNNEENRLLSHLKVWKCIIENQIQCCTVFEDSIKFHKNWDILAGMYYSITPKNFHIVLLGCDFETSSLYVDTIPVYLRHAYIITLEGAYILYHLIMGETLMYPLDKMIYDLMIINREELRWYIWNVEMFPDKYPFTSDNKGIVFYDPNLYSYFTYMKQICKNTIRSISSIIR